MSSEKNETARLEAFCDGVFAIAITLLVLEIRIPPAGTLHSIQDFWREMLNDWPSWFGFALSFTIIFVAWVNHHNVFKLIQKSSPQFIYANGFLLFTVAALSFSTGLMAEHMRTELAQPAISVYCFTILLHNISWIVFGRTSLHPVMLYKDEAVKSLFIKAVYRNSQYAFVFYLALSLLSFWFPIASVVLMTLSWIVWVFTAILVSPVENK